MTASTTTHPQSRKQTIRPSLWRLMAGYYVDLLLCGFIAWIICYTFQKQAYWFSTMVFLYICELIWCRDRLNPTTGEYCVGIRYLTSSSSQVVADIKVVHQKLQLNGFLLTAGVVELTLAILFFTGWTFLGKAVLFGQCLLPPLSVAYWALAGFVFFFCGGYLLSGSKMAFWTVPAVHVFFLAEFFLSAPVWRKLIQNEPLPAGFLHLINSAPFPLLHLFVFWSLFVFGTLAFSRKYLVN